MTSDAQVGDSVEEFQPICEVQSDKASIEITSRYSGKITNLHHAQGDMVKVRRRQRQEADASRASHASCM